MRPTRRHSEQRGGVYPLVLIVCAAGAAAALTGLTIRQATDNRSAAIGELTSARLLARSGIEASLQVIAENDTWRIDYGANEVHSYTLTPGTVDVLISDETDVDLSDEDTDPYTLTSTATVGAAKATLQVTVDPDILDYRDRVLAMSPIGFWPLDETSGFTANNIAASQNGSITNPASLNQLTGPDGRPAALFDDLVSFAFIPHHDELLIETGTIMFNFCVDVVTARQSVLSKNTDGRNGDGHFEVYLSEWKGEAELYVRFEDDRSTTDIYVMTIAPGPWHHVAVAFDANGMNVYVDGKHERVNGRVKGLGVEAGGAGNQLNLIVGATVNGSTVSSVLEGSVRDVIVIPATLTQVEIDQLFNASGVGIDADKWTWVVD